VNNHPLLTSNWRVDYDGASQIQILNRGHLVHTATATDSEVDTVVENFIKSLAPVPFADLREEKLIEGILTLAEKNGCRLERPHGIDANGEIAVVGAPKEPGIDGSRHAYGENFAAILRKYPTRTGIHVTKGHTLPTTVWCYINHFVVERMLRAELPEFPFIGHDTPRWT
jgi:hypothetical protein